MDTRPIQLLRAGTAIGVDQFRFGHHCAEIKSSVTVYLTLVSLSIIECRRELEQRRRVPRSKTCRTPTTGSRQGMMAGPKMVGRGHVALL
jgi:hypothetical protein